MKLLSIDGAIGAPLSLRLLTATEERRPGFIKRADMIVGSSSGAGAAAYLAIHIGQDDAENLRALRRATELTDDLLRAIHPTPSNLLWLASGLGSFLSPCAFEDAIAPFFPDEWTLGRLEAEGRPRLLTLALATEWRARYLFRSFNFDTRYGDIDRAVRVRDAVLASSALPVLLPHRRVTVGDRHRRQGAVTLSFVDGSLTGNNPSVYALHRALTYLMTLDPQPRRYPRDYLSDLVVLSFGPRNVLPPLSDAPPGWEPRLGSGLLHYAFHLASSALFTLDVQEDVADVICRQLLGPSFCRVDPQLLESKAAWAALLCGAESALDLMRKRAAEIITSWDEDPRYLRWVDSEWMRPRFRDGDRGRWDRLDDPGDDMLFDP